jgi:hypothetical protein
MTLKAQQGTSRAYTVRRLQFGRFLNFSTAVESPLTTAVVNRETLPTNLTEWRFRKYWERAPDCGGNERQRSKQTLILRALFARFLSMFCEARVGC